MRITRLEIRDFRRYHDLDVDLAPGLTVIRGPNEAGKTTIQRAIELALTRKVTSTGADLDALRPWDATNDDARPAVRLEFTYEDDEGVRQGSLEKVFRGSKGTVRLEIDGQTITDPTRAEQVLAELTGIPSEAFFRSTASVRHHEVADLDRDEAALRDRLQASISGADRGTSRAKRLLERAIRDLQAKGDRNPGQIKAARDEVARLERVVADGEAALAALERDRDALTVARERRATAEAVLRERRGMLEKARQAERLTAERASAEERFQRYRTAVEVATQLDALRTNHPSPQPLPILRAGVERLRGLEARIRELRAALGSEVDVRFEVPPEPTWRPLSRVAVLVVLLGVVVAVGGVGLDVLGLLRLGDIPVYGGAALVGVGFVLALVGFWLRRRDRLARHLRDEEIARRLRGRSEMEEELKRAERDLAAQLAGLGLADLAAAEDLLAREEAHVAQIERLEAQLRGLVGDEPVETLAGKRDEAALEIEQKRHALEALGPIAREPRARERLEVEVQGRRGGPRAGPGRRGEGGRPGRGERRRCRAGRRGHRTARPRPRAAGSGRAPGTGLRRLPGGHRDGRTGDDADGDPVPGEADGRRPRPGDGRALPPSGCRRPEPRHRSLRPRKRWLGRRPPTQPGDDRPRLPRRPPRARPSRDERPPAAPRPRRSLRHLRRDAGEASP
ncbi:MAG: hypothetical protein KatS3mg065_0071 [Chloroflexota bacterium]|nr:MAG: hypothetical protein KatS3mg065_0071 [Chloroflexota bacterium]